MTYNPNVDHRRSIRLNGYDYSQAGLYFITICCHQRNHLFGHIVGANQHSPNRSPNQHSPNHHSPNRSPNQHSPNHSSPNQHSPNQHSCRSPHLSNDAGNHPARMKLNDAGKIAEQCWLAIPDHFPNVQLHEYIIMPNHIHGIIEIVGAKNISPPTSPSPPTPLRSPSKTIGSMVRGFKIGVTKWMRQNTDIYIVWQRNYYEHIIRDEQSYHRISNYIIANPQNWVQDKFYS